jgi:hypothetical protein
VRTRKTQAGPCPLQHHHHQAARLLSAASRGRLCHSISLP